MHRPHRAALLGATLTSGLAALLGLAWLLGPWAGFYADPAGSWLAAAAGPGAATLVHAVAALVGLGAGLAALAGALPRRATAVAAAAEVLTFGVVLQGIGTLSTLGYLLALAMPLVVVVLLVQVVRRHRLARWLVGVPALVAIGVLAVVGRDALARLTVVLGAGLAREAGDLGVILLLLAVGTTWAAVGVGAVAGTPALARLEDRVVRHRTAITIVAACGPLPYALARLTWLTPWPVLGHEGLDLSTRIWGLVLSSGAWLGFVLTLGLIRPWGEVFPRWVPVLAGRPVPVAAAAVPGGIVAAGLCFSAVPLLLLPAGGLVSGLVSAIAFPCWLWGPSLALAVWGYVAHRRRSADRAPAGPALAGAHAPAGA